MKIFRCPGCSAELFFDKLVCACGLAVVHNPAAQRFVTDRPFCANRDSLRCNWTCAPDRTLCDSCCMTSVHPDLSVPGNDELWARAEAAKRRTLAGLIRLAGSRPTIPARSPVSTCWPRRPPPAVSRSPSAMPNPFPS